MDNKVLRPKVFFDNLPSFKVEDEKAKEKGANEEERQLYAMSQTKGWHIYKEFVENLIRDLDNASSQGIEQGLSYEEIGKNTIVVSMAKDILRRALNKVQDARDVIENDTR